MFFLGSLITRNSTFCMKKNLYFFLCMITLMSFSFVSCGDDDEDNPISHSTTPEIETAGTYNGTWTKEQVGGDTTTGTGTLTLSATDADGKSTKNVTYVTVSCSDMKLEKSSTANISYANDFYWFNNMATTNGFRTKFSGKINADGSATIAFTLVERVGRKTYTFNYTFEGKK